MSDLVVRGGAVVTTTGVVIADIAVEDELVLQIEPNLPAGREEIDATGLTVFPGLVDVHVHFNDPGRAAWEGAATGSRAFDAGGGTTFIDMPLNSSPCTLSAGDFDRKLAALKAASVTDFGIWGGLVPGNVERLAELAERGVAGFKAFLCDSGLLEFPRADDLTLWEGMREAARLDLPVAIHAESEDIVKGLTKRLLAAGRCDIPAFLQSRPVIAEVEAIHRAGFFARQTGCRLHIVHISSGSGVAAALEARAAGADISLETCPHYLFFTEDDLLRIGAIAKCAPPLRSAPEREALWQAVLRGDIEIIGSDHSPCPPEMKRRENFFEVWGGVAGVQTTLPALIDLGLPPQRIAATTATNGARRFRLANKGAIEAGYDADFALVDMAGHCVVSESTLLHRHKVSPYAGCSLRGAVRATIRGGIANNQNPGRFIRPQRNPHA